MSISIEVFVLCVIMLLVVILAVQIQLGQVNGELGEIKRKLDQLINGH